MKYRVENINKSYDDTLILEDISIDFEEHKTTCILGESGAGKTTLLNIIGGISERDSGRVIGFQEQDNSFVFQEDRLIKWKNVKDNISFVLKDKMDRLQIEKTIDEYLKIVNLEEYKYHYPKELSGGIRQRINILRAFIYPSDILIMDEPFKSLDINNKKIMIDLFQDLSRIEKKTCILVTHDIEEAISLGDKIVILSNKPGRVEGVIENIPLLDDNDERKIQLRELVESKLKEKS